MHSKCTDFQAPCKKHLGAPLCMYSCTHSSDFKKYTYCATNDRNTMKLSHTQN